MKTLFEEVSSANHPNTLFISHFHHFKRFYHDPWYAIINRFDVFSNNNQSNIGQDDGRGILFLVFEEKEVGED